MTAPKTPFSSAGFEAKVLSVQRRAEMFEKTQLGKGLDWNEALTLSGFMDAYQASAGSEVCREGDESAFLCLICQGRVDVIKEDLEHNSKVIASLGPGNSLGEMSLIDGETRSATAVVNTQVELLVLTRDRFDVLQEEYPRLWGKLVARIASVLSRRLRRTSGVLAEYLEN